ARGGGVGAGGGSLFVGRPLVADYAAAQTLRREGSGYRLEIAAAANAQPPARLSGVLVAETDDTPVALAVDVPLATTTAAGTDKASSAPSAPRATAPAAPAAPQAPAATPPPAPSP